MSAEARPAFYALESHGWRDYVTLLHLPYTAWHLSYVAVGAALAPEFDLGLFGATAAAFFLAIGVAAHALDELNGRPLRTSIPTGVLVALAAVSLAGAAAIGVVTAVSSNLWLLAFVAAGVVLVCAYNLELAGGVLHNDATFALAWGGFPVLTAYFAQAEDIRVPALFAAAFAVSSSVAQRQLSTAARHVRRRTRSVTGTIELADGGREPISAETLLRPAEAALRALTVAMVALGGGLVLLRTISF